MPSTARQPRRWPSVPGALGALGWLCTGPLVATLLVGRTGFLPSFRWLAAAAGGWLLLAAIGLLSPPFGPSLPARFSRGLSAVAGTASLAPLLPVLYLHDPSYHLTVSGPASPARLLAAFPFLLAIAGGAFARLFAPGRGASATPQSIASPGPHAASPVFWVVIAAVGAATLVDQGLWGPLAAAGASLASVAPLLGNLVSLAVAAWLAARAVCAGWLGAAVLLTAWLWFAPLAAVLTTGVPGPVMVVAAADLRALVSRYRAAGRAGLALAWLCLGIASFVVPPFWAPPELSNGSIQALYSRLYSGPGALVPSALGTAPVEPVLAARALTAGTLTCGAVLVAWWLAATRPWRTARVLAAACLLLDATLALAPATPRWLTSLAALSLVPLLDPALWSSIDRRRQVALAALTIAGYVLAGTSIEMLLRAAAGWLNRWPALATLPAFGLALLALGQALILDTPIQAEATRARVDGAPNGRVPVGSGPQPRG